MENVLQQQTRETLGQQRRPLLIFGSGPVIDSMTRDILDANPGAPNNAEAVNFWSINMGTAAHELYTRDKVSEIVILGGKTGGEQYKSESELIRDHMIRLGVPESVITVEDQSKDTIANLINVVNIINTKGNSDSTQFQILGTDFHTLRIQVLMKLLCIPYAEVFSSEALLRLRARETENVSELNRLDRIQDMNDDLFLRETLGLSWTESNKITSFYKHQKGVEVKDFAFRKIWEQVLIRELVQYPESWLGRILDIKDHKLRKTILRNAEIYNPGILKKYEIDLTEDAMDVLEQKIQTIQKKPLTPEDIVEWMKDELTDSWPKEVRDRCNAIFALA